VKRPYRVLQFQPVERYEVDRDHKRAGPPIVRSAAAVDGDIFLDRGEGEDKRATAIPTPIP
jgi:hypothetical protein